MLHSSARMRVTSAPREGLTSDRSPALVRSPRAQMPVARHRTSDRGASAVEYALLIAGIAAVIIVSVAFVGKTVSGQFSKVGSSIAETK